MSRHSYPIGAAGIELFDVTAHTLVKEAAALFPGRSVQGGHGGGGVILDLTPDLDAPDVPALDALVAAHKARRVAHIYTRSADDIDLRVLGR